MTSTWSLGRIKLPAALAGLILVETARMPGGQNGCKHAALAGLDQLLRR